MIKKINFKIKYLSTYEHWKLQRFLILYLIWTYFLYKYSYINIPTIDIEFT